jgi:hypothetical protein
MRDRFNQPEPSNHVNKPKPGSGPGSAGNSNLIGVSCQYRDRRPDATASFADPLSVVRDF